MLVLISAWVRPYFSAAAWSEGPPLLPLPFPWGPWHWLQNCLNSPAPSATSGSAGAGATALPGAGLSTLQAASRPQSSINPIILTMAHLR
jgi:hypothetical protein